MRSLSGRFTVVLILLASTWPATRALGADRFVSAVGNDTANDCLTSLTPCRTLAHALAQAASSDTIDVAGGTYQEPPLLIDFTTTLTFSGGWTPDFGSRDPALNPTVLDGAGQAELLDVSAGAGEVVDVTVDGFTLRDGEGFAGAALVQTQGDGNLSLAFQSCVITDTVSGNGGVFALSSNTSSLNLSFTDCALTRNIDLVGGAIRLTCGDTSALSLSITRSRIEKNRGVLGGAVLAESTATGTMTVTLVDSIVARNGAAQRNLSHGGGLWISNFGGVANVDITNTIFSRNKIFGTGGAIYAQGTVNLTVTNSTFTRNQTRAFSTETTSGRGGGIFLTGASTVTLTNTILWGNRAAREGRDLFMEESPGTLTVNADHDDIDDRTTASGTFNDLGGNLQIDPRLSRVDSRLTAGSPAIDTGTCVGAPTTDFEGDPRPTGGGCDMGADEFVP